MEGTGRDLRETAHARHLPRVRGDGDTAAGDTPVLRRPAPMTPMHVVTVRRWQLGLAFIGITAVFVVTIMWVQVGRVSSCQRTYEGIRQVFQPFLTPPPNPSD